MKRGKGSRPLLEFEIKGAQSISKTAKECARKLHVDYRTYKKYAKMYGIFENVLNKSGKGTVKYFNPNRGKCSIQSIIAGEHPNYPKRKLKDKLVKSGIKDDQCDICGYSEKRITDGMTPIWINFKDGNKKNHTIENIEFLCFNCFHNTVGRFFGNEKIVK
jgi:hypothetical protein